MSLRYWNQYGFETDVFDKYRESMLDTNRNAVTVLGSLGLAISVAVSVFSLTDNNTGGLVFCAVLFLCSVLGILVARQKYSQGKWVLPMGYLIAVAFHLLNIYGSVVRNTAAFWLGAELAIVCYLVDYAKHIGIMQIASYIAMQVAWLGNGTEIDSARNFFCLLYLVVGLVTFYTVNRARIRLIMGREESQRQADTDLLTGLTMRTAAQKMITDHLRTDEHGVMMLLDLDRFKSVNDRLGHQMGDKVLIEVAADLRKMFRNSDVLSRLGGDEFVVYMKSVPEKEWALQRAGQVVREVRRWVGDGTTNIQISASVGIVMTDMVERTYDSLYRAADVAMYCAKREGGNKALFFTPEMMERAQQEEDQRHLTREVLQEENSLR